MFQRRQRSSMCGRPRQGGSSFQTAWPTPRTRPRWSRRRRHNRALAVHAHQEWPVTDLQWLITSETARPMRRGGCYRSSWCWRCSARFCGSARSCARSHCSVDATSPPRAILRTGDFRRGATGNWAAAHRDPSFFEQILKLVRSGSGVRREDGCFNGYIIDITCAFKRQLRTGERANGRSPS